VLFLLPFMGGGPNARSATGSAVQPARGWCEAPANEAWRAVAAGAVVGASRTASIVPMAPASDGRTFFAEIWSPSFSGVARIDGGTSKVTRIRAFPDETNDQALGRFDGRWLVWREYHSLYNVNDFSVWAWDSHGGEPKRIGAAGKAPNGSSWPSSFRNPDVRDGIATWEQGSGPGGIGDIHVFDLASGRDRIVRHAHVGGAFFYGGLIVWSESLRPDALTVMRAVDARTRKSRSVPASLRSLRGVSGLFTDGRAIAYPDAHYKSLWWSPKPSVAPRRLFGTAYGDSVANSVQIAGRYIVFGVEPHTYVVDTATQRYLELKGGGWGSMNSHALVLLKPSSAKAQHTISDVLFLPLRSLPPMPRCR
jgi:hypothetical protein